MPKKTERPGLGEGGDALGQRLQELRLPLVAPRGRALRKPRLRQSKLSQALRFDLL